MRINASERVDSTQTNGLVGGAVLLTQNGYAFRNKPNEHVEFSFKLSMSIFNTAIYVKVLNGWSSSLPIHCRI